VLLQLNKEYFPTKYVIICRVSKKELDWLC
jgi:hypothetical protein